MPYNLYFNYRKQQFEATKEEKLKNQQREYEAQKQYRDHLQVYVFDCYLNISFMLSCNVINHSSNTFISESRNYCSLSTLICIV